MTRPFFRWLLFATCLAVFLGAMLWVSLRTLELEAQRETAAEDAQVQERLRLALWRMDSLASALLIRENSRPPSHYQPFYAPEDLFSNGKDSRVIPKGQALQPSPLLGVQPDLVQLNFELVPGTPLLCSPQVPTGEQGQLANQWYSLRPELQANSEKLTQLDSLLKRHPEVQKLQGLAITAAPPPDFQSLQQGTLSKNGLGKNEDLTSQGAANFREQNRRSLIVQNGIAIEKAETFNVASKKKEAAAPAAESPAPSSTSSAQASAGKPKPSSSLDAVTSRYSDRQSIVTDYNEPADKVAEKAIATSRQPLPTIAGDLRPVWVEKELLLLRRVSVEGKDRLQGVWLDWPKLQARLLETVRDLLPNASFLPLPPDVAQTDATALVTLPLKLITGKVSIDPIVLASPLKPALAIAWACVLAAAIAIAFVLHRAVLLSERRGAFVSSVTHELRTPLTTFRLYSEMLAEDMIPDAARRREYLQTLCDESTRLMHLVENVLAYSRIERGRTAARLETLNVAALLDRTLPRLRQRTDQVDLTLQSECSPDLQSAKVAVDALAVEQILFNLVDNACKYAAPASEPRELHLHTTATAKSVTFELRDFGPGLSKEARKKLFRPFGKSATEAAHSAPGVGLGLALCRRLARELGGDLTFHLPEGRGASFRLTLKRALS